MRNSLGVLRVMETPCMMGDGRVRPPKPPPMTTTSTTPCTLHMYPPITLLHRTSVRHRCRGTLRSLRTSTRDVQAACARTLI
eukprot:6130625-Pyramimonas_sp.AAC.2